MKQFFLFVVLDFLEVGEGLRLEGKLLNDLVDITDTGRQLDFKHGLFVLFQPLGL